MNGNNVQDVRKSLGRRAMPLFFVSFNRAPYQRVRDFRVLTRPERFFVFDLKERTGLEFARSSVVVVPIADHRRHCRCGSPSTVTALRVLFTRFCLRRLFLSYTTLV